MRGAGALALYVYQLQSGFGARLHEVQVPLCPSLKLPQGAMLQPACGGFVCMCMHFGMGSGHAFCTVFGVRRNANGTLDAVAAEVCTEQRITSSSSACCRTNDAQCLPCLLLQVLLGEGYGIDNLGRLCLDASDHHLQWARCALFYLACKAKVAATEELVRLHVPFIAVLSVCTDTAPGKSHQIGKKQM